MIDLTPLEVRKKKGDFRRQLRGYDPGQVDDFLDVVADRLEQLVRENLSATERLTRLEQQVTEFRDRERAMTEALVTAQQMREQMQSQVVKEVELAKRQAVQDAERIRAEAVQESEREEENLARLRQRQRQLLQSFRSFLERELSELVVFSKGLEFDEGESDDETPVRSRRSSSRSRFAAGRTAPAPAEDVEEEPQPQPEPPRAQEARRYEPPPAEESRHAPPRAAVGPAEPATLHVAPPAAPHGNPPAAPAGAPFGRPDMEAGPPAAPGEAGETSARLDAFGEFLDDSVGAARAAAEPPPAVTDRPEPVESSGAAPRTAPSDESLADVSEAEIGGLFSGWGESRSPEPERATAAGSSAEPAVEEPLSDEEFLDDLLMSEAELLLSDEDVLEDPLEELAFEEVGGDPDAAKFALEEELLVEEAAADALPGDQPVELGLLSDEDEFADLNIEDLGLPPLPSKPDPSVFDSSGLTLRPLPADQEAPEVPRDRRDDDDDMFTSLFGKPR